MVRLVFVGQQRESVSFLCFLVFLLGINAFPRTARKQMKRCHREVLSCTQRINLQNLLPHGIFKGNSSTGVREG